MAPLSLNLKENRDLKNHAYHTIKQRLINCIYEPGSVLNENQLAGDLGLSRTPVREAINRLESEGLVKVLPKKGIFVTDIHLNDVLQIFQARLEIEPIALRMAAPHLPLEELLRFQQIFTEEFPDIKNGSSRCLDDRGKSNHGTTGCYWPFGWRNRLGYIYSLLSVLLSATGPDTFQNAGIV